MFEKTDLDELIADKEKKIIELDIRNETLDNLTRDFLEELKVTPEQLTSYIGNEENFTEKNWKELQVEREKLEVKLRREIENIRDPLSVKKAYSERNIGQHWLFVR